MLRSTAFLTNFSGLSARAEAVHIAAQITPTNIIGTLGIRSIRTRRSVYAAGLGEQSVDRKSGLTLGPALAPRSGGLPLLEFNIGKIHVAVGENVKSEDMLTFRQ